MKPSLAGTALRGGGRTQDESVRYLHIGKVAMNFVWLLVLFFTMAVAQITPAIPKASEDEQALRGIKTYWVQDVKETPLEVLQQLAGVLEQDIPGITPAKTREEADVAIELRSRPTEQLGAQGTLVLVYDGLVYCRGTLVWRWSGKSSMFTGDKHVGEDFGRFIVKKW